MDSDVRLMRFAECVRGGKRSADESLEMVIGDDGEIYGQLKKARKQQQLAQLPQQPVVQPPVKAVAGVPYEYWLPEELWFLVFDGIPLKKLRQFQRVSKHWHRILAKYFVNRAGQVFEKFPTCRCNYSIDERDHTTFFTLPGSGVPQRVLLSQKKGLVKLLGIDWDKCTHEKCGCKTLVLTAIVQMKVAPHQYSDVKVFDILGCEAGPANPLHSTDVHRCTKYTDPTIERYKMRNLSYVIPDPVYELTSYVSSVFYSIRHMPKAWSKEKRLSYIYIYERYFQMVGLVEYGDMFKAERLVNDAVLL